MSTWECCILACSINFTKQTSQCYLWTTQYFHCIEQLSLQPASHYTLYNVQWPDKWWEISGSMAVILRNFRWLYNKKFQDISSDSMAIIWRYLSWIYNRDPNKLLYGREHKIWLLSCYLYYLLAKLEICSARFLPPSLCLLVIDT